MFASGKILIRSVLTIFLVILAVSACANGNDDLASLSIDGINLGALESSVSDKLGEPDEKVQKVAGLGYRLASLNGSDLLTYGDTLLSIRESRVVAIHGQRLSFMGQEIVAKGQSLSSTVDSVSRRFGSPDEIESTSSYDPDEKSASWKLGQVFLRVIFVKDLTDEVQLYTR